MNAPEKEQSGWSYAGTCVVLMGCVALFPMAASMELLVYADGSLVREEAGAALFWVACLFLAPFTLVLFGVVVFFAGIALFLGVANTLPRAIGFLLEKRRCLRDAWEMRRLFREHAAWKQHAPGKTIH